MTSNIALRAFTLCGALMLALALAAIVWRANLNPALIAELLPVVFVGIGGATIANASGVGGGVVFVPVFDYFNSAGIVPVSAQQIVATSFLIQCFGMSTGSLTWLNKMQSEQGVVTGVPKGDFTRIVLWVLAGCLPALLATQYLLAFAPANVLFWFKSLSICLGAALLFSVWRDNPKARARTSLARADLAVLIVLGVIGGFATALFSVGVGELVALYLFIRNYPLVTCAATAVIITAVTVITGMVFHLLHTDVPWALAAFAVPGAIIGGYIARGFAYFLGPYRLKILAGLWIVGSSVYLLAVHG
ncbi:sulfite exporter TauE/SafE family protein [Simiduia sp. 21SJ11W-1]|uniref:sulfite exporter TauE/SafE family protein n=1 Tax=Simiduia sp. 21SJ11W-1 TaxID=2909669 RepID=UPI00209F90D6|nr:sulfite exporter TauE/SafE family protein [Simiduia sp. 21SJ11W-1]UTA47676.1 sulfite exporter TauE/SafE family protein [Simiduia sp. 21SJ11W-1]